MLEKLYIKTILLLLVLLVLSGCLPVIFTGATGSVVEMAKDRPVGDALTDARIATAIKTNFIKKGFRPLYSKIKTEVIQGRVLFTGVIEKEEDAITAVQVAWEQEGVIEVINELKVDKSSRTFNLVQYTKDTMITSQIKSKTFVNRDIKFVNYTVITLNDIVYLFGIARSEEELEKVASIASNVYGVEKVISHVKIQPFVNKTKLRPAKKEVTGDEVFIEQGSDSSTPADNAVANDW